jgi:hypothetical protein
LYPQAGRIVLGNSTFWLDYFDRMGTDRHQIDEMVRNRNVMLLTSPTQVELVKQWASDPVVRVILLDGPRKGEMMYCRRHHLTKPPTR